MLNYNFGLIIFKKCFFIFLSLLSILNIGVLRSEYNYNNNKEIIQNNINKNQYILDSGDVLFLKFDDFPEYNQFIRIQNDGNLYLPKIGNIYAEDLLIEELNSIIFEKYSQIMDNPFIEIFLAKQRPIKIVLSGEVAKPGLYTISKNDGADRTNYFDPAPASPFGYVDNFSVGNSPTLYEGIKLANGITNQTDLENIELRRKIPNKYGGGYKKTNLNLLSIFINGDKSNNIKLMDGDVIIFKKSKNKISNQIIQASKTNINPATIGVYVTGRVRNPGLKSLKSGATLNEAISVAGGPKVLRGKIELITSRNDKLLVKNYKYNPNKINAKDNPVLQTGDIVRIRNSGLSATTEIFGEILPPIIGIGTVKDILD